MNEMTNRIDREFAEQFATTLRAKMLLAAGLWLEESGMGELLIESHNKECVKLLNDHLQDAIGDMPIWDVVTKWEGA